MPDILNNPVAEKHKPSGFVLQVSPPAYVPASLGDGPAVDIDPYEAWDAMFAAGEKHPEDTAARWNVIRIWISAKFNVNPEGLARNQIYDFYDLIEAVVKDLDEERKKKVETMRCLPRSIPASPATIASGQTMKNGDGSTPIVTCEHGPDGMK